MKLAPATIDPQSGYRYYRQEQLELARTITFLRTLDLPISDIKNIIQNRSSDEEILDVLQRQKTEIHNRIARYRKVARMLDEFITHEKEAEMMSAQENQIVEKQVGTMLVASIRMKGHYSECGKAFGKIGRSFGRYICDKPMLLHHDTEYKETDADFEACVPIRQRKDVEGITVQQLPAARCITLIHKGPYDQLGRSYAKVLTHVQQQGLKIVMPTREIYIKGPGMIFKGNPAKYLTEIQIPVE